MRDETRSVVVEALRRERAHLFGRRKGLDRALEDFEHDSAVAAPRTTRDDRALVDRRLELLGDALEELEGRRDPVRVARAPETAIALVVGVGALLARRSVQRSGPVVEAFLAGAPLSAPRALAELLADVSALAETARDPETYELATLEGNAADVLLSLVSLLLAAGLGTSGRTDHREWLAAPVALAEGGRE